MKIKHLILSTIFLLTVSLNGLQAQETTAFPVLKGDYLGQMLPGDIPSIFAPGIVSVNGRYEYGVSFAPDLKEIYFTAHKKGEKSSVYFSKLVDKKWTSPTKANLTKGQKREEMEAFVSPSGNKIYFTAYDSRDVRIWQASRSGSWWADPIKLDSPINDDIVFYSNQAKNGDLYYKNVSKGKMYYAPSKNGKFPEIVEAGIAYGSHGFISPSQDFMLIDALKDNDKTKDKDIHVCFKKKDGTWTKPINLGPDVNSNFNESCPSLTPDGKYLFFSRYNEEGGIPNIYWVSTDIIKRLKAKTMQEASPQKSSNLKGYYYDQDLPGDSAVIFAPGKISLTNRLESNIALSPDGKECYFGTLEIKDRKLSYKIYQSKFENNKWTEQTEAPFSLNNNFSDPVFSADGKKLYVSKDGNILMLERSLDGWGEPQLLPSPINSDSREISYTETTDGVAYVSSKRPDGFGGIDIWRINQLDDQSLQAENIGPTINSMYFDYSPFIAPDGSYLIFGSYRARRDGLLYISFNEGDDIWTTPINMNSCGAKVNNTTAHHSNPSLSPDGKYLFFRRHEADTVMDVFWVSAEILNPLKEKALQKYSSQKFANLKGDYLGQTPPGEIPLVFAPGIVSTDTTIEHGSPTFSPDGNEVYWQSNYRQKGEETQIFGITMQRFNNTWHAPTISPNISGPAFSPNGNRLYFLPFGERNGEKNGPYFVEKEGGNWGRPVCMDLIKHFPEIKYAYNYSVTHDGTFYFLGHAEGLGSKNDFGIYRMELNNDEYSKPELLPASINIGEGLLSWTPFIAPDESYLLFSSNRRSPKTDMGDIYISFRDSEGNWTDPVNLGEEVNSDRQERFPSVSPDGKYLFFTRWVSPGNEDIMWVSAKIIDDLKKEVFNPSNK